MSNRKPIRSLLEFFDAFPDENACEDYLFELRYSKGFVCPLCGYTACCKISGRREFQCSRCRHQESLTARTVMHKTRLPLRKWFLAVYLVTHDKRGISAMRLAWELGVARDTAYRMLCSIRSAMADVAIPLNLSGTVELDDAYIGSKGGLRGRGTDRAPFVAAVEKSKGGLLCMRATECLRGDDYKEFARWHVCKTARILTDGLNAIRAGLSSWSGLDSAVYDKHDKERCLPTVHHAISNFKAMINGTYHGVRKVFLQSYMDEYTYRYNNRRNVYIFHTLLTDLYLSPSRSKCEIIELFAVQTTQKKKAA